MSEFKVALQLFIFFFLIFMVLYSASMEANQNSEYKQLINEGLEVINNGRR